MLTKSAPFQISLQATLDEILRSILIASWIIASSSSIWEAVNDEGRNRVKLFRAPSSSPCKSSHLGVSGRKGRAMQSITGIAYKTAS